MSQEKNMCFFLKRLKDHAIKQPHSIAMTGFDKQGKKVSISYQELVQRIAKTSFYLKSNKLLKENDICIVLCEDDLIEFVVEILSVIVCKAIAIPMKPELFKDKFNMCNYMVEQTQAQLILAKDTVREMQELMPNTLVTKLPLDEINRLEHEENELDLEMEQDQVVMMMYTSGSTKKPKIIPITQYGIYKISDIYAKENKRDEQTVMLSCLALHHVFALVVLLFHTLWGGGRTILVSLEEFIKNPIIWFELVTKYRVTHTGTTNYMIAMLNKMEKSIRKGQYDLSSLRSMIASTEFIQPSNIQTFFDITKELSFDEHAFATSYGMSETAGLVTLSTYMEKVQIAEVREQRGYVIEESNKEMKKELLYSVGKVLPEYSVIILNVDDDKVLEHSEIGEICIYGPSVLGDYLGSKEDTEYFVEIDNKRYLKTGDLGFILESTLGKGQELYICGRSKEVLILRGLNYSPHYIEYIVEEYIPTTIKDVIAFSTLSEETEELSIILGESHQNLKKDRELIAEKLSVELVKRLGIMPHKVIFSRTEDILKTSSGKLKRSEMKSYVSKSLWEGEVIYPGEVESKYEEVEKVLMEFVTKYSKETEDLLNTPLMKLGFNSLLIQMMIAEVNKKFGMRLPVNILTMYPTVQQLSAFIESEY